MTEGSSPDREGLKSFAQALHATPSDVAVLREGKLECRWCEQEQLSLMIQIGAIDLAASPAQVGTDRAAHRCHGIGDVGSGSHARGSTQR